MACDLLSCPICCEQLREPKILPSCGHTLCGACTQRICAPGRRSVACPLCRTHFHAADVRPNFTVQALLEEYGDTTLAAPSPELFTGRELAREQIPAQVKASRRKNLEFLGVPSRLAAAVADEDCHIGKRIFLLDNSGSTGVCDGKVVEATPEGGYAIKRCTRWTEIKQIAIDQAGWNARLGTPCEFVLLNPVGMSRPQEGVDFACVDAHKGPAQPQISALQRMLDMSGSRGGTPIAARVREIAQRVAAESASLTAMGQRIILVIVTDGVPTTSSGEPARRELVQVLRHMMLTLPINVVIRLCTDDDDVVEFYSEFEADVELPVDVLDDVMGEALEVKKAGNGWFAYTQEIHRIREGGTFVQILDLIDERRLTPAESACLAQLLLRDEDQGPLPRDPEGFCTEVAAAAAEAPLVFCMRRRRMVPVVDVAGLRAAVLGSWTFFPDFLNPLIICTSVLVS